MYIASDSLSDLRKLRKYIIYIIYKNIFVAPDSFRNENKCQVGRDTCWEEEELFVRGGIYFHVSRACDVTRIHNKL